MAGKGMVSMEDFELLKVLGTGGEYHMLAITESLISIYMYTNS